MGNEGQNLHYLIMCSFRRKQNWIKQNSSERNWVLDLTYFFLHGTVLISILDERIVFLHQGELMHFTFKRGTLGVEKDGRTPSCPAREMESILLTNEVTGDPYRLMALFVMIKFRMWRSEQVAERWWRKEYLEVRKLQTESEMLDGVLNSPKWEEVELVDPYFYTETNIIIST